MESWKEEMPETTESLRKRLHVDDLLSGGLTLEKARERKNSAIEIFRDAKVYLTQIELQHDRVGRQPGYRTTTS